MRHLRTLSLAIRAKFILKALMNMPKTEFRTILIRQRILCDAHLELNPTLNIQKIGSAQVNFYLQYIHFSYTVYVQK